MNVISRLFNRSEQSEGIPSLDAIYVEGRRIPIPKLTINKWRQLVGAVETLPQIIASVLTTRHTEDFTSSVVVGASLAFDEAVRIVAVLADVEPEFIADNMSGLELSEFLRLTAERNDLQAMLKNFLAVRDLFRKKSDPDGNPEA